MRKTRISETMQNIDQKYVDEATEYKNNKNATPRKVWHKWIAVAACFAIVLAVGIPVVSDLFVSPDQKDIVDSIMLIEYDDAYWEIIENNPEAIKKYGLAEEITEKVIGNHIAYLQKEVPEAERSNYIIANEETNTELLEYYPAPYKAVRIFRDGDKYYYAWFCNYLVKNNESLPIMDAFEVYGIDEASDIKSITPTKSDNEWKANGASITDSTLISAFFSEISKLTAFSFDEYHEDVFAGELGKYEDKGGGDVGSELYTRVADDRKDILIETKDGLRFVIHYYPSYGWINITKTLSYYQMSPEITEWLENNIE